MPVTIQRRANSALWWGLIVTLLGVASNFLYFVTTAGSSIFPWLTLLVSAAGLVLLVVGLRRAFAPPQMSRNVAGSILFGRPEVYRGKILGSIFTVVSVVVFGLSTVGFFHARAVPPSAGAPKVGQKAPDFTATNTSGESVSLAQFLSLPIDAASGRAPKAVLLVFYRGYW